MAWRKNRSRIENPSCGTTLIGHTSKGVWRAQALTHAVGFLFAKLAANKTMNNYTFKMFLGRNWWFLLMGFASALRQSEKESVFGSTILDILFGEAIILVIMFAYWFIRYGRKHVK